MGPVGVPNTTLIFLLSSYVWHYIYLFFLPHCHSSDHILMRYECLVFLCLLEIILIPSFFFPFRIS
jgi:hypothetical protein